tara:strand:+ start:1398 stop:2258 length:861 start_codon:yes stop_codon:yes gene_type:complete
MRIAPVSDDQLLDEIYTKMAEEEFHLPVLPDMAVRVREAMHNPDYSIRQIARILSADQALCIHILRVVNSPLYRGQNKIDNLQDAIARLGLRTTRQLALSLVIKSLFKTKHILLKKKLKSIWEYSTRLAAISGVIAHYCPNYDGEKGLISGLFQDVGALPIISMAHKYPALRQGDNLAVFIDKFTKDAGVQLLETWQFDEELLNVVKSREDWMRDPDSKADYADIVLIARLHSFIGTPKFKQCPRIDQLPAYRKLPLGKLTPEFSLWILDEAEKEIKQVQSDLQSV